MNTQNYLTSLKSELQKAYAISSEARSKGYDPEREVEVKIAPDVAARVEGIVGPKGIAEIIRNMIEKGMAREDVAFEIARKISGGEIIKGTKEQLVEQAVRTGLGILTEGVLVAPTEGIAKVRIKNNPDGSDYIAVYYSGPIRSAGGTAVALSVLLADIARRVAGVGDYRATDTQIERYNEEVSIYEARVAHLQYKPPEDDIRWITKNCPVCVDGEPTEEIEVGTFRSVPGVETNRIRGGIPLVICEGIAQKAAKVFKYTKKLNLGWSWLEKIIKVSKKEDKVDITPDFTYLEGLVAGRPVFAYPSTIGGFRLRYGKSRTNSLMAKNVHPATMIVLSNFLAYGTHMKIERPGKGCVISGHELLEPPVVKLKDGSVVKVHTIEQAKEIEHEIEQIIFLGDMLITYGDFLKSNYPLLPSAWCEEWFTKEVEAKGVQPVTITTAKDAFEFSLKHSLPLAPSFTYHWGDLKKEELGKLAEWLSNAKLQFGENGELNGAIIANAPEKIYLETLLLEHLVVDGKIILEKDNAYSLFHTLGLVTKDNTLGLEKFAAVFSKFDSPFIILKECSGIEIKNKAPTYIGARMGRPEKAKERKMDGSPHVLFPTGSQKNRSIAKVYKTIKGTEMEKTINLELARMRCIKCSALTFYSRCDICGGDAKVERACVKCNKATESEIHCDNRTIIYDRRPVNIMSVLENTKKKLGFMPEEVKGVKGLSNAGRVPERIEKGFFRSKYGVYVFRDGTSRFDATDIPLTHFIPREIGASIEQLKALGYDKDYFGNELTSEDQLVTIYHQDIILSDNGAEYFMKVANFLDDLLVNLYGMQSFYNLKRREDLIGHLCAALSPHTSAAVLCRIIGFTRATVGYGHPYFHTAKRRNCFYPTTRVIIEHGNQKGKTIDATLEEIIEKLIADKTSAIKKLDDKTTKIDAGEELFVRSIDRKSKRVVRRKIKCFLKTEPPEYWVKVITKSGKEMSVTPDHNVLCIEGGNLKAVQAGNLKIRQSIPIKDGLSFIPDEIMKLETFIETKNAYCLDIETETDDLIEKNVLLENGIFCIRCDGDEDCVMMLLDALLNFSRNYLDEKRGGTMDTPLVLSPTLDPKEVDDEAHCIEMVTSYPLEFYQATERFALPNEIKIKTVKDVLGTDEQFDIPLTMLGGYIDKGNIRTAYVQLDSIPDKIKIQFELHEKIKAVDEKDAAERLILSHFIPDLYGNLRSFSRQTFRCGNCNESFRRVPLAGKCNRCGGNLLLTINKGGIQKYLEISREIIERYQLPDYLKQRMDLLDKEIKSIFEDDKIKQLGLADFI